VAYRETRYQGPFDWNYNGKLISVSGAKGPMQIMPSTANYVSGKKISQKDLLYNIDLNVQISMKLLSKLHKQYKDWAVICGYYNTGLPIINDYAKFCAFNKDYKKNWVKY
jgi:soluble lytic murein transglycosylase-like protein